MLLVFSSICLTTGLSGFGAAIAAEGANNPLTSIKPRSAVTILLDFMN